jgi:hypothetical protein
MFTLDYRLDSNATPKVNEVDMALVDLASLRYYLFPGDIVVRGERADFSTCWGWVQVLDFALSIKAIQAALEQDRAARFEFTESNAVLEFRRERDEICASSSYASGLLRVSVPDFREEVGRFARSVAQNLCAQYPRLALNPEFKRCLAAET